MSESEVCQKCGASVETAVNGECPTCLVRLAMGEDSVDQSSSRASQPSPEEVAEWFPDYSDVSLLGYGGMGVVYRARHRTLDREVAIKILSPSLTDSPSFGDRFRREAQALAKLSHPHIVTVHDAGDVGGISYLVMELVDGEDLQTKLSKSGPATVREAVDWIAQAAEGLAYAHENRVIHRDVKPGNLLIDAEGTIKILDLGLAKFDDEGEGATHETALTLTNHVLGSVDFMSPEQAEDTHAADARSDIYSLGCTLYYLLAGDPMYRHSTAVKRILAHREDALPSLCDVRDDVAAEIDQVFRKMVAKEPKDRYQSMAEVAEALSHSLTGAVSSAKRSGRVVDRPPSRSLFKLICGLTLAASLLIAFATIVYRIQTNYGTLNVEIDEDAAAEIEAKLHDGGLVLHDSRHDQRWTIKPRQAKQMPVGSYRLESSDGLLLHISNDAGVELSSDEFLMKRSGNIIVRVTLSPQNTTEPSPTAEEVAEAPPLLVNSGQELGAAASVSVVLADLDGDEDLDAYVGNYIGNGHEPDQVWLNDGAGVFTAFATVGNLSSTSAKLGDLDGDGDLDALVVCEYEPGVVWLGDGKGGFVDSGQQLPISDCHASELGDLDGDGDLDAVIGSGGHNGPAASRVFLNDGSGVFTATDQQLGKHTTWGVELGDVDGDGDLDIVFANGDNAWRNTPEPDEIWLNDGEGDFSLSPHSLGTRYSRGMDLGDLDDDGDLDAVVVSFHKGNSVWINDGKGRFVMSPDILGEGRYISVTVSDIDGDGDRDAALVGLGGIFEVWLNDGKGRFPNKWNLSTGVDTESVGIGDLDGDGDADAFLAATAQRSNQVWFNQLVDKSPEKSANGSPNWSADPNGGPLQVFPENEIWADVFSVVSTEISSDQRELRLSGTRGHVVFDFRKMQQGSGRDECLLRHFEDVPSYNAFYAPDGTSLVGLQKVTDNRMEVARFGLPDGNVEHIYAETNSRVLVPSPDRSTFFMKTVGDDSIIHVDTAIGERLHEFIVEEKKPQHVALSADGNLLAASFGDECVVWDVASQEQIASLPTSRVKFAFSRDGKLLVFFDDEGQVAVWDVQRQEQLGEFLIGDQAIRAVKVLSDNRRGLAVSNDGKGYLFELLSGQVQAALICTNKMPEQTLEILSLDITDDGRWAVTGANDRRCRLFRLPPAERAE